MKRTVCTLPVEIRSSQVKHVSECGRDDRFQVIVVSFYVTQVQIDENIRGNSVCCQASLYLDRCRGETIFRHC
jgi:hypothetical protein